MKNQELAQIFNEISLYLEMDEIPFRPQAYEKAALTLEGLEIDVEDIYKEGGIKALDKLPGIGKHISEKIEEYIKEGKIKYYEDLKKKSPVKIGELTAVEGMGPKKIKTLYKKLGVKNLKDLEKAAKEHKIAPLFGFGEKTEKNILEGIAFLKRSKGRFLLGEILPIVKEIEDKLKELKEVKQISVAGSVRRKKETIGDVDFLVSTDDSEKIMDFFVSLPKVEKVWGKGKTKSSIRVSDGFDIDVRVVADKSYGSALQYFTGSKDHNIATRRIAIKKELKLNEYGLFKKEKMIAGWDEKDVYEKLGLIWMEPELRENNGEIEASLKNNLPKLINLKDIKGDLHCHSSWNGGRNSILEIAQKAQSLNYKYVGVSDHTQFLKIENGLDEKQLAKQKKEIDKLNEKFKKQKLDFKILQGAETNILKDGSIDINDKALKNLDYAIAGVHSSFKLSKEKMTERIIKAIKNPYIKIISHPTGRLLKRRDEYEIDFDKILKAAKDFNTILEINANPIRLDLNEVNIKKAIKAGVKLSINTDVHDKSQFNLMEFGIYQARRGWAEKKDVVNTFNINKLMKLFK